MITRLLLIRRSLAFHRRIHFAVALGIAAATAVLTGALLVGDSVRGSLQSLTHERLGKIESVLALDRFFRLELAAELSQSPEFQQQYNVLAPAILFPQATLERRSDGETARASAVLVLGSDERFWQLDSSGVRPSPFPQDNEIVLNEPLAAELHAAVGDEVTLRLPKSNQVPADSPLANKNDRIQSVPNLKVVAVIPAKGLGRFNLQASQALPRNAFVSLGTLQAALEQPDRINALFVGDSTTTNANPTELSWWLHPKLDDFSITIKPVKQVFTQGESTEIAFEYFTITTDRMIFEDRLAETILKTVQPLGGQPVLTYLANSIDRSGSEQASTTTKGVPYSMVTAIDLTDGYQLPGTDGGPLGPLAEDEIILNSWTAENLQAKPGDTIRLAFFEPETTHGEAVERTVEFKLKGITPLTKPAQPYDRKRPATYDQPPTTANDPDLTPEVKGVTDQDTIDDWDAPFPFDYARVRQVDEDYWDFYRTTPKAFISLAAGKKIWGSRFGQVTSFRVPATKVSLEQLRTVVSEAVGTQSERLGFEFIPIKQQQMAASRGTTPFDVLFLFLSFFVIAAALLMVALLFRLGVEQRATELGTMLAVGFTRRSIGRQFVLEGLVVSAIGAGIGVLIGVGYARMMIAGLTTWWLGAISSPFLQFHWTSRSLAIGYILGVLTALATIAWSIRQTRRISARNLLAGQPTESPWIEKQTNTKRPGRLHHWSKKIPAPLWLLVVAAIALSAMATRLGGMAQGGAFVGSGALLLVALMIAVRRRFRRQGMSAKPAWNRRSLLLGLAERNAARNPTRSVITVGLMAAATFLIVAMSSFRLAPTERGIGGFRFIAQSSEPVFADLNSAASRSEFFGTRATVFQNSTILGLRLRPGDDASCQNLYQSVQPRVLGVTAQVVNHFDSSAAIPFVWASSDAETDAERANPWRVLFRERTADTPVPAVLDKNTAMYSLHLYRGIGEEFEYEYDGRPVRFRVAGLLDNSVLQGSLLIGETDFRRSFPQISGFRYFLVATPAEQAAAVEAALEDRFGDQGLDVTPAREILEQLLAVQNTYLSTFQSLGALGLLLGAFGLATVQLRNIIERRGELALMQAVGYRRRRIAQLVLLENLVLLALGLSTGVIAALLAVLPHKLLGESAISWLLLRDLGVMLLVIFLAGLISSFLTVRAVLRQRLLPALRGE